MTTSSRHESLPILVALLSMLSAAPALADASLRRHAGQWSLSAGPAAIFDSSLAGMGGAMLSVERAFSPHVALNARLLVGAASGPVLSGLEGWGVAAQAGVRLYLFDSIFTPYVGGDLGVLKLQLKPENEGSLFGGTATEASRHNLSRFIAMGTVGLDMTTRSGFFTALEAQAGAALGSEDSSVFLAHIKVGYRF